MALEMTLKAEDIKSVFFRAIKLPLLYFLFGLGLSLLSYVDNLHILTQWKNIFDITEKLGSIFIALSFLTFLYNLLVLSLQQFETKLAQNHSVAALILSSVRKGLRVIFVLISLNIIIAFITPSEFYLILANNIFNTIIIASVGWIAVQILYTCEAVLYQQMMTLTRREHVRAKALYTKMHIIRNIMSVIIIIITAAAILMSFSSVRSIGISLLASAGFLTAILGLAAQKTLFSLFSGLQIALSQPIKIGDIVVIEGNSGIIEEITFTYVTMKLGDGRRLIVPINQFIEKSFENWSRDGDRLRSSVTLYVDYLLPIQPIREKLTAILKASPLWDQCANKVEVSNLTDQSVEVRLQISAANSDDMGALKAEVREKMLAFIRENYPEFFPKRRLIESR